MFSSLCSPPFFIDAYNKKPQSQRQFGDDIKLKLAEL
jgi:hypothetical protein